MKARLPYRRDMFQYLSQSANKRGANHIIFAAFLCLHYIFPHCIRPDGETYHSSLLTVIRLLGVVMCILLLLKNYWPTRVRPYFAAYWHIAVIYTLPFVTTFSCLAMGGTTRWLINILLAIMVLSNLVEGLIFMIIALLGTALGIACYYSLFYIFRSETPASIDLAVKYNLGYAFVLATLIGFFLQRREKVVDKRLETLELLRKIIGAEIQSILAMGRAYVNNIKFSIHQLHIEEVLPPEDHQEFYLIKADKKVYLSLQETIDSLVHDSARGAQTLHRLLANLCQKVDKDGFTTLSMKKCVTDALEAYSLTKNQKSSLFINLDEDFLFYGSADYMQHMLFNLLDNAFKHSQKNCTLEIWISHNRLYVKDNGSGVAKEALPYIFDPFFTTAKAAMGIGLSFCRLVMEAFGGTIICKSKQGRRPFAEFVLTFPSGVHNPLQ